MKTPNSVSSEPGAGQLMELALTDWLIREAGMTQDVGRILLGRMETRVKIDKLTEIARHTRNEALSTRLRDLAKSAATHSDVRNTIIHSHCMGTWSTYPDTLLFLGNKFINDSPSHIGVVRIKLQEIIEAAKFAGTVAGQILEGNARQLYSKLVQDTPDDSPPNPIA